MNFLEVGRFIDIIQKDSDYTIRPDRVYFSCEKKSDIVVSVDRIVFEKEPYLRSIVGCLIKLFEDTKIPYEKIDDWETWMMIVGGKNTVRRGIYQHIFFNRLLDDVTRKELKINDYDKQNIYYLLRYVLENFAILWQKDNLSMINKRLRCAEYLSTLITAEISKRINRLVSLGDKATIKEFINIFKFPNDIFISRLAGSGVLRYAETVNDLDSYASVMYTKKGRQCGPRPRGSGPRSWPWPVRGGCGWCPRSGGPGAPPRRPWRRRRPPAAPRSFFNTFFKIIPPLFKRITH